MDDKAKRDINFIAQVSIIALGINIMNAILLTWMYFKTM